MLEVEQRSGLQHRDVGGGSGGGYESFNSVGKFEKCKYVFYRHLTSHFLNFLNAFNFFQSKLLRFFTRTIPDNKDSCGG